MIMMNKEDCVYYGISEVWSGRDYIADSEYCKKKSAPLYDPMKDGEYFDHNIKCPCKTYFKKIEESEKLAQALEPKETESEEN